MLRKNPFRLFLYLVIGIVVLKLCYNLGYSFVKKRADETTNTPRHVSNARRQGQELRGVQAEPVDSAAAADSAR
ncbi:hypothetical protein MUN81_20060 [Hymenobacter sp. 5317J-9]|uniref:hypothetical protein n=1 Tax=Hymenobacter sp. 5317J-9 TaxID=2932250 RepID=UPI001FD690B3|nr:hypothetical protein [Hymenobacter sp. 5317J-9]UOQ97513.1 hypothetical protein MUN81_20060 [Hymenobacter sp. 5317J-9]